ncbi:MAG: hypothetical protein HZA48_13155 [Planctomycetes bacterium]|nr:hypothetical protein [Planctomycetota bacterium]
MTKLAYKTILVVLILFTTAGCAAKTYPEKAFYRKSYRKNESSRLTFLQVFEQKETLNEMGVTRRTKGRPLGFYEETENKITGLKEPKKIYYVYDNDFMIIGFIFPDGSTFKYESDGYPKQVGVFQKNDGVKTLLNFEGKIVYQPLEVDEFE